MERQVPRMEEERDRLETRLVEIKADLERLEAEHRDETPISDAELSLKEERDEIEAKLGLH